jgi:thiol-disulfide isomerase/thioredoxin
MPDRRNQRKTSASRSRIPWALISIGGLILLISLALILRPPPDDAIHPIRLGKKMSDFQLPDLNGNLVRLSDFTGKTVLINTWATWCPPCRQEMPDLIRFYQDNQHRDFIILAINAGESADRARAFAIDIGMPFPVLLDSNISISEGLGINGYPTSVLVGPNGVIEKIKVGMFLPGELEIEIGPYLQD